MVKKVAKKVSKKAAKKVAKPVEAEEGTSLDDAFGDDDGVEYAPTKVKTKAKNKGVNEDELDEELDQIERSNGLLEPQEYVLNASKPVGQLKKGDLVTIDGQKYTIDAHYVLIDHGSTKEMALELYNSQDKDFQLRYFNDQVETTLEFYELQEIMFVKKPFVKVSW